MGHYPDLTEAQLQETRALMHEHVEDCLVTGYEPLIDELVLPDPNDRHVLAAAIKCEAKFILTNNLKHFPRTRWLRIACKRKTSIAFF